MKFSHLHPVAVASLAPALIPLGGVWPYLVIITLIYFQYSFFRHQIHLHRELIFSTYVSEESPLMRLRPYTLFVKALAFVLSVFFAVLTFLGLFSAGWIGCIALFTGAFGGSILGEYLSGRVMSHARDNIREYYSLKWTFGLAVALAVAVFVTVDLLSTLGDYGTWDAPKVAKTIIETRKHDCKWVQDIARTMDYIHYTKLRLRDVVSFGWVIYIFMIIPSVLPIYGAVAAMFGVTRVINANKKIS